MEWPYNHYMLLVLIWKFPAEEKGLHAATKVESVLFSTYA